MSETTTAFRDDVLARLRALEQRLRAQGVTALWLFGSVARGDHRVDSDVDVMVRIDTSGWTSGWTIGGIYNDIAEAVGREVSLVEDHPGLSARFRERIADDLLRVF